METYRSIPVWLRVGNSADEIIYRDRSGAVARASWLPDESHDTFGVKIGGEDSPVSGTLVGERYSRQLLQQAIRVGALPLRTDYVVTDRDDDLMKLVAIGDLPAWDALVAPVLARLHLSAPPSSGPGDSNPGVVPPTPGRPDGGVLEKPTPIGTAQDPAMGLVFKLQDALRGMADVQVFDAVSLKIVKMSDTEYWRTTVAPLLKSMFMSS